jgi:gamma-glutamylcyclotransferase (GGCT)/AIG2-like uncharacterized protein YtfP
VADVKGWGELLSGIGTIILSSTAVFAFFSYWREIKRERLKWLQQLYEKFYNQKRYKPVRQRIDFDDLDDLLLLLHKTRDLAKPPSLEDRNKIDEFTDYLNFFEWIAFLKSDKQLSFKNLDVMFNYYLTRTLEIDAKHSGKLVKYLIENGYEKFVELLSKHYAPKTADLFVYGTLKKGGDLHRELVQRGASFCGEAKIAGRLFQIAGEPYPGAIASDAGKQVCGEMYRLKDPLRALWAIDLVEECDQGLYERKLVDVTLEDGQIVKGWSYFYSQPLGDSVEIADGRFSVHGAGRKAAQGA